MYLCARIIDAASFFLRFWYLIVELFMQCSMFNVHVIGIIYLSFCFAWCVKMLLQTNVSKIGGQHFACQAKLNNTPLITYLCKVKDFRGYSKIYLLFLLTYRHTICIAYKHYNCDIFLTYTHYSHGIILINTNFRHEIMLPCKRDRPDIIVPCTRDIHDILLT